MVLAWFCIFFVNMKYLIGFLLLNIFIVSGALAQDDLATAFNQKDAEGKKHGVWKKFDENGKIIYEGKFDHDIPIGEFQYYYPNGKPKAVLVHSGDGIHSYTTIYHNNGYILATGGYQNEKKDGLWIFYNEYGIKVTEEFYDDTKRSGKWTTYYLDGKVAEEISWKDDEKNGQWIQFFREGSIKLVACYKDDFKDGPFKMYYPNQQVGLSGTYTMGKRTGQWIHFMEDGQMQKQQIFSNGIIVSEVIYIEIEDEELKN